MGRWSSIKILEGNPTSQKKRKKQTESNKYQEKKKKGEEKRKWRSRETKFDEEEVPKVKKKWYSLGISLTFIVRGLVFSSS